MRTTRTLVIVAGIALGLIVGIATVSFLRIITELYSAIAARDFIKRFDADPAAGLPAYGIPAMPYRFSGTPAAITKRAPMLGEHTDSILASLGFSLEEIAGLREKKIV